MSADTTLEAAFEGALQNTLRRLAAPPSVEPFAARRMLDLAEDAVRRIDVWGTRGVTDISTEHIAAMACVIAASGAVDHLRARLAAPSVNETPKKEAPDGQDHG